MCASRRSQAPSDWAEYGRRKGMRRCNPRDLLLKTQDSVRRENVLESELMKRTDHLSGSGFSVHCGHSARAECYQRRGRHVSTDADSRECLDTGNHGGSHKAFLSLGCNRFRVVGTKLSCAKATSWDCSCR